MIRLACVNEEIRKPTYLQLERRISQLTDQLQEERARKKTLLDRICNLTVENENLRVLANV